MKSKYSIKRPETEWEGLTLDEIRYARALTETRILISREILGSRFRNTLGGKIASASSRSMIGRMFSGLSWLDLGLMTLRLGSKVTGFFRRK